MCVCVCVCVCVYVYVVPNVKNVHICMNENLRKPWEKGLHAFNQCSACMIHMMHTMNQRFQAIVHVCMHTYVHECTHSQVLASGVRLWGASIQAPSKHVSIKPYIHTYIYIYTLVSNHIYIYIYICIYTYIHTQTHTYVYIHIQINTYIGAYIHRLCMCHTHANLLRVYVHCIRPWGPQFCPPAVS
jgi:hypothetical protein